MQDVTETRIFRCMSRVGDLIVINLLMLLFSLPVVTMGAAITAAYDLSQRLLRGDTPSILRGYVRAFRVNFRKATGIWLIFLVLLMISIGDLLARRFLPAISPLLTLAAGVQLVFGVSVMLYAFPLQARYENTIRATWKNATIFALCRLPYTVLMLVIAGLPFGVLLSVPVTSRLFSCAVSLCVFVGFAGTIYMNAYVTGRIFARQFREDTAEVSANYIAYPTVEMNKL